MDSTKYNRELLALDYRCSLKEKYDSLHDIKANVSSYNLSQDGDYYAFEFLNTIPLNFLQLIQETGVRVQIQSSSATSLVRNSNGEMAPEKVPTQYVTVHPEHIEGVMNLVSSPKKNVAPNPYTGNKNLYFQANDKPKTYDLPPEHTKIQAITENIRELSRDKRVRIISQAGKYSISFTDNTKANAFCSKHLPESTPKETSIQDTIYYLVAVSIEDMNKFYGNNKEITSIHNDDPSSVQNEPPEQEVCSIQ